ncbi:carbohydrate ABC transporter permease [Cohnella cholangitidis]|uniref:Carbohydrate ABC transporter permease n=1 Tax=Cohnella cholangitidis TaxID=2598458 RepID=A0A7G5C149_9BACL|nr:carbohydrate ABC transporter permease [Cohnella cholangitidis]QMV42933.1 carbohydrate ABC transporter permease [Cohnella cholangitidis]
MWAKDRRTRGDVIFDNLNIIAMLLICFATLYPIWYVLVNSFNDGKDAMTGGNIYWIPRQFSLENYTTVFDNAGIMTAMGVTVAKTLIGTVIHVFFTAMVAYALSRKELIFRNVYMIIGTITLFFSGGLIPTYLWFRDLGLLDTFGVYIYPAMFSFFDLIIFLAFFREIPEGLEEAAKIDGANDFTIFVRIVLPVSLPVVATIALFHGVWQWNDYFTGLLYTNNDKLQPIQTFLYRIIAQSSSNQIVGATGGAINRTVTSQSIKLATMVITTLPIVLAYPFLQKYFVKGLMIGSLKG